ncbi:MAG: cysteine--tRNA ligase [Gemmatimonadota bacterium]
MTLVLYNTLSRSLEPFEPQVPGEVRMYTCGPTVYDRAHIGNFRAFIWEDLLRRYLRWKGYRVTQVMNLTDVDDRTIATANARGITLREVTAPVSEQFFEDWETLGLEPVEVNPRATEHVPQMIELVKQLEEGGFTYTKDGCVYFAIERYPEYGRLINLDTSELAPGRQIEGDEEYSKDDPRDFVLWKGGARDEEEAAQWDSPWGVGRPGWHLECSAMAMEYLGETLDIHTGGVDNIFPHHVNEMAQSEAATGAPFARYWLHAEHLLVDGGKMSKSLGNYHTVPSLVEEGVQPSAIRYLLLSAHYRTQLNFTRDGLDKAARALDRLADFRRRVQAANGPGDPEAGQRLAQLAASFMSDFEAALDEDLAVAEALAAVFALVRDVNSVLDDSADVSASECAAVKEALESFEAVFGVFALRDREAGVDSELRTWIEERIEMRESARQERDFERADAVREELKARGIVLEDSPSGTTWKRISHER